MDFEKMTLHELKKLAKKGNISIKGLKKAEIILRLKDLGKDTESMTGKKSKESLLKKKTSGGMVGEDSIQDLSNDDSYTSANTSHIVDDDSPGLEEEYKDYTPYEGETLERTDLDKSELISYEDIKNEVGVNNEADKFKNTEHLLQNDVAIREDAYEEGTLDRGIKNKAEHKEIPENDTNKTKEDQIKNWADKNEKHNLNKEEHEKLEGKKELQNREKKRRIKGEPIKHKNNILYEKNNSSARDVKIDMPKEPKQGYKKDNVNNLGKNNQKNVNKNEIDYDLTTTPSIKNWMAHKEDSKSSLVDQESQIEHNEIRKDDSLLNTALLSEKEKKEARMKRFGILSKTKGKRIYSEEEMKKIEERKKRFAS